MSNAPKLDGTLNEVPCFGTIRAQVRNPNRYTNEKGETFYFADAEIPAPSNARWSTYRLRVRSGSPIEPGIHDVLLESFDGKKCEGVVRI